MARLIRSGIEYQHLNNDTLGRALDCIYTYGIEDLYMMTAAASIEKLSPVNFPVIRTMGWAGKGKMLNRINGLDADDTLAPRCQPSPSQENLQDQKSVCYLVNFLFAEDQYNALFLLSLTLFQIFIKWNLVFSSMVNIFVRFKYYLFDYYPDF